jgi:4,5-dihydroxyphthalate decarboxylase
VRLSIGIGRYDRTQPLLDGRVAVDGVSAQFSSPPLEELFARAFDTGEFDIAELSFSNFLYLTSLGNCPYIGLPVFPSRMFRHSAIFIRDDRGIVAPRDLAGKKVGVREYSMTAALAARGALEDEYGVDAASIRWRCGRADAADSAPIVRVRPREIELESIPDADNLSDLLRDGELDAVIAYTPPRCFVEGAAGVRRLFENAAQAEQDYFARTGIFPIMHLLGVRKDIAERHPDILVAVLDAFEAAKRIAIDAIAGYQALAVSLPWAPAEATRVAALMGKDYWPYGVPRNRAAIGAIARWSHRQGLAARELEMTQLFAAASLDWNGK